LPLSGIDEICRLNFDPENLAEAVEAREEIPDVASKIHVVGSLCGQTICHLGSRDSPDRRAVHHRRENGDHDGRDFRPRDIAAGASGHRSLLSALSAFRHPKKTGPFKISAGSAI
jgi:hypothetical protein